MHNSIINSELIEYIADLNEEETHSLIRRSLADGIDPLEVIKECQQGLRKVGERYERQEYFIAGLVMAGQIFREAMKILLPAVKEKMSGDVSGSILLGTVAGDIHDIGKDMAGDLMICHGIDVHDLGVNVSPQKFYEEASRQHPDIIGISILITSSMDSRRVMTSFLRFRVSRPGHFKMLGPGEASPLRCSPDPSAREPGGPPFPNILK